MKNYISHVPVCFNTRTKLTILTPINDCIIAVNENGEAIKLKDLVAFFNAQNERIDMLQNKLDELGLKYNALNAAYKANAAKTAMQILETKENN